MYILLSFSESFLLDRFFYKFGTLERSLKGFDVFVYRYTIRLYFVMSGGFIICTRRRQPDGHMLRKGTCCYLRKMKDIVSMLVKGFENDVCVLA